MWLLRNLYNQNACWVKDIKLWTFSKSFIVSENSKGLLNLLWISSSMLALSFDGRVTCLNFLKPGCVLLRIFPSSRSCFTFGSSAILWLVANEHLCKTKIEMRIMFELNCGSIYTAHAVAFKIYITWREFVAN